MDFATLESLIQNNLKENIFKIRAESLGNSQIIGVTKLLYNGELLLDQATLTIMENRLIVTGHHTVDILGQSSLYGSYEFFLVDEKPQCTIGIILPDDWIPESLKFTLDEIFRIFQCTYNISDIGLIISSVAGGNPPQNVSHLPSVPLTIPQGFLIFSSFDGSGPVFDLLESILGELMPLNLRNLLNTEDLTPGPIEAALQLSLPALGPISFSNTRFVFQREGFTLVNDISLDIGNEVLLLQGGGRVQPDNTFEISFSLMGVRKEGQQEVSTNAWINPLGLTGLTIRTFIVNIGIETRGTVFGMFGEIALGQEGDPDQIILEVGGEIINGNTPQAMIASIRSRTPSSDGIALTKIIEGLSMIPIGDFPILNQIKVEHFEVYIVLTPEGYRHPVNNVTYYGLSLNTSISLFGLSIRADMQFIPDTGVKAIGELGQINLGGVLEITDASGKRGPLFQIDTTQGIEQDMRYVYLSCKLSLFGLSTTLEAKAKQDHFCLCLKYSVKGLGKLEFDCQLKKEEFHGSSQVNFDFGDRTIQISIGGQQIGGVNLGSQTVGSIRLGGHISGKIEVHLTAQTFQLNLSGDLSALGLPELSVEVTINESLNDLSNLIEIFYQKLVDQAEELLRTPLKNPALLLEWTKSGVVNLTREVGDILSNVYRTPVGDASKILKKAQFNATQTAQVLAKHYSDSANIIGSMLKIGGYGARETLEGLYQGLGWKTDIAVGELVSSFGLGNTAINAAAEVLGGEIFADTLKDLKYPHIWIGNGLRHLDWSAEQIVQKFHQIGTNINVVTNFLKDNMVLDAKAISNLYKNLIGLNEIDTAKTLFVFKDINLIASTLKDVWNKQISEVTAILKGTELPLNLVSFGTLHLANLEFGNDHSKITESISEALAFAGYRIEDVAQGIKFTYTLTDEKLTSLLLISDFSPGDVAKYVRKSLNWDSEKIGKVFAQFNVEPDKILEGLKDAEFPEVDVQKANEKIREILSTGASSINLGEIRIRKPIKW